MRLYSIILFYILLSTSAYNQEEHLAEQVNSIIHQNYKHWGLSKADVVEYFIRDSHRSQHSGVTHVYINQLCNGVIVDNGVINLNLNKNGNLIFAGTNFIKDIHNKINSTIPVISPAESINLCAKEFGIELVDNLKRLKSKSEREYLFGKTRFTRDNIRVYLCYRRVTEGKLKLAWKLEFSMAQNPDSWHVYIDAITGELIDKINQTLYCSFPLPSIESVSADCESMADLGNSVNTRVLFPPDNLNPYTDGAKYRVYALPTESPVHGNSILITDPADPLSSPFGWHDTDGIAGPEYTITRGNNAHAFQDQDGDDASGGDEPDGSQSLIFDFEYDTLAHPSQSLDAVVTNLFYTLNYMHDFAYIFGFNEQAGNFQENNYGNGGDESDYVIAQALALDQDSDGQPQTNNANFASPLDGSSGVMNMYLWNVNNGTNRIQITSPLEIEGPIESSVAGFGTPVGSNPLKGIVVISNDGISTPTDACQDIQNDSEIAGNIALIDRGICEFGSKVLNAENNGAIAAIICNVAGVNGGNGDELLSGGMGAGVDGNKVGIPSLFLKKSDCDLIKMVIEGGTDVEVNLQLINPPAGPSQVSSSLDNGIISHEYAHGISNRLTGGRTNSGCLSNDEQMGEGWSDFFALVVSHEPGDQGSDVKGIGNYVLREDPDGRGIRRFPYSTDMNINPLTYNLIRGTSSPHSLGEVWTVCLWDMYWNFIDLYGFDPDWSNRESGNFKAVQLVMDGMKYQKCNPGFVDGRDAILAADQELYSGDHQCLIWKTFARRGVGYDAVQGLPFSRNDNEEGFEPLPTCIEELKIEKTATEVVAAGDIIEVSIYVVNHKPDKVSHVIFTDFLEDGLSFSENLSDKQVTVEGDMITFEIGDMESLDELVINYTLQTDLDRQSLRQSFDDFESESTSLIQFPIQPGNYEWQKVDFDAFSGTHSWFISNDSVNLDQALVTSQKFLVQGEKPTLKFVHKYETEFGFDGGFIEVSEDNGLNWSQIKNDKFLRNGYNSNIDFFTFAIPELLGFTGDSHGWLDSYLDLSDYKGLEIFLRFRFGCDDAELPSGDNKGWYIDDVELLDLLKYSGDSACVQSDEGDEACDDASTLIKYIEDTTPTSEISFSEPEVKIYPNPSPGIINISMYSNATTEALITIFTIDGKSVWKEWKDVYEGENLFVLDLTGFSNSLLFVQVQTERDMDVEKVIIY